MSAALAEETADTTVYRPGWTIFALVGLVIGVLRVESIADPNVLWETRDGLNILSSGHLPRSDAWSWTVNGRHWIPNSWGWDVVLGAAYRLGSGTGLVVLNLLLVVALFVAMSAVAMRSGAPRRMTLMAVGVLGGVIMMPWVIVRPQLASYLFVLAVVPLVRRILNSDRRAVVGWLVVLAAGQLVWVNLHLFGVIGPGLVVVAGLGYVLAHRRDTTDPLVSVRERAVRLGIATALAAGMCAITPYGAVAASKSLAVRHDAVGLIVEWRPAGFSSFSQFTAVLALAVAVLAGTHAARVRRWDVLALIIVLGIGAATACRFAPALGVIALPELAAFGAGSQPRRWVPRAGAVIGGAVVLLAIGVGIAQLSEFGKLRRTSNSAALIGELPKGCRVLNDYQLGGALIMFRPDVKVSVDSRTDLYGRTGIDDNANLLADAGPTLNDTLNESRVRCVLAPTNSPAVRFLHREPDQWHVVGVEGGRTLLTRT